MQGILGSLVRLGRKCDMFQNTRVGSQFWLLPMFGLESGSTWVNPLQNLLNSRCKVAICLNIYGLCCIASLGQSHLAAPMGSRSTTRYNCVLDMIAALRDHCTSGGTIGQILGINFCPPIGCAAVDFVASLLDVLQDTFCTCHQVGTGPSLGLVQVPQGQVSILGHTSGYIAWYPARCSIVNFKQQSQESPHLDTSQTRWSIQLLRL